MTTLSQESPRIRSGVLALTGYAMNLRVNRGHLVVEDGVGSHRRRARFSRVTPELERVVVVGHSGTITLDALRWIRDRNAAFVQIDNDGEVLVTSEPEGRASSELVRAQVLAVESELALELARQLIHYKVEGQRGVLGLLDGGEAQVPKLEAELKACAEAETGKELAQHEAQAALAYWAAWVPLTVRFKKAADVPAHWRTVGGRRSPLMAASNRNAVTPAHAMLNYLYAVLLAEARLAALQVGFDPGLGLLHATYQGRDSLALDLMEPMRPMADEWVLGLLASRTFEKDDFFETREGVCRIMPPLARELSETSGLWREPLRKLTEAVAKQIVQAGDRGSRGLLSTAKGHTSNGRRLSRSIGRFRWSPDTLPTNAWKAQLRERHKENRRWERKHGSESRELSWERDIFPSLAAVQLADIQKATGLSPSYSAQIRRGYRVPHRRHWKALRELTQAAREQADRRRELEKRFSGVDFERDILPGLQDVHVREIQEVTGLSERYVYEIRNGEKVPRLEHWPAFAKLASRAKEGDVLPVRA